ncbi:2-deydro-3-deoxyphosphogluconate aldolase/4-hydroxy-2-oxoglutarate aldolase [Legionella beliardensis]|uniref:2-dehydro-3-deoxy-phosphogluconate aldolase n=1 Tax=Legionella beliardensis TaxID=91822 RepID=A0A378I1Y1_9GAMM|nr:2-deydro-3-deoxyphosphogluconate aldolase/4-hydroxy-2-oxoglutarate aldolase [Legionella beliardensis]
MPPEVLFSQGPIIPVLVIRHLEDAIPLATALISSGISLLEVTLRTATALEAIRLLRLEFPDIIIGAGTVTSPAQLEQAIQAGAQFAISPGLTRELLQAGKDSTIPLIPGIASISELMEGLQFGFNHFKFFPAEVAGGIAMLKAISGPFPNVHFCPTGGINEHNFLDYLNLPNVSCVGGSWIVPDEATKTKNWEKIKMLSSAAITQAISALGKFVLQKN